MKKSIFTTIFLSGAAARSALAAGSPETAAQGNLLILLFLGFVALIVVAQMVPAMILMMEMVSGLTRGIAGRKRMVLAAEREEEK